jgi:hypothetical protein
MERTITFWRVREEAYRAIARSCGNRRKRDIWLGLAASCAAQAASPEPPRAAPGSAPSAEAPRFAAERASPPG